MILKTKIHWLVIYFTGLFLFACTSIQTSAESLSNQTTIDSDASVAVLVPSPVRTLNLNSESIVEGFSQASCVCSWHREQRSGLTCMVWSCRNCPDSPCRRTKIICVNPGIY